MECGREEEKERESERSRGSESDRKKGDREGRRDALTMRVVMLEKGRAEI